MNKTSSNEPKQPNKQDKYRQSFDETRRIDRRDLETHRQKNRGSTQRSDFDQIYFDLEDLDPMSSYNEFDRSDEGLSFVDRVRATAGEASQKLKARRAERDRQREAKVEQKAAEREAKAQQKAAEQEARERQKAAAQAERERQAEEEARERTIQAEEEAVLARKQAAEEAVAAVERDLEVAEAAAECAMKAARAAQERERQLLAEIETLRKEQAGEAANDSDVAAGTEAEEGGEVESLRNQAVQEAADRSQTLEVAADISEEADEQGNTAEATEVESLASSEDTTNTEFAASYSAEATREAALSDDSDECVHLMNRLMPDERVEKVREQFCFQQDDTDVDDEVTLDELEEIIGYDEDEIDELSEQITSKTQRYDGPILTDQALREYGIRRDIESKNHEDLDWDPDRDEAEEDGDSVVSGAAWLTVGNIISRVLGALYVIPWATWLGDAYTEANVLYSVGYKPYSLFLAIATAGFPSAIAKQMAYYHSMKEYRVADKLFKNSAIIMGVTGAFSALLLYALAPFLAVNSATNDPGAAILVIRSLAPALLILPIMSLLRGYFQGFSDMKPTAVSQIIEQVMRVVYLLVATYAIMQILTGNVTDAVVHSTFAAFVGALASLIYLLVIYLRRQPVIQQLKLRSLDRVEVDFKASIKIMVIDSVPFILLGSGIIIAQLVDTYSFRQILEATSILLTSEISEMYGTISLDVDKLSMIIVSLAVSLATALVPTVTKYFANRDIKGTSQLVTRIMEMFTLIMLPAALGMAAIADNVYTFFYPTGSLHGPAYLVTASLTAIVLGLYTVLSTILQSMNFRRAAVRFLVVGLLIKLVLQFPFVALWKGHGALLSTGVAFLATSVFSWIKLKRELDFDHHYLRRELGKVVIAAIIMGIVAFMWNNVLNVLFGPVGRLLTLVKILLVVLMAVLIYAIILGLFGKLELILGDRYKELQEEMKILP